MDKKRKLSLIITGPTGVGKTDFSISLADKLNAEIINIDVGQFYEPLSVGTAKPNWQNEPIAHHLFDIITEPKDFTVVEYQKAVQEELVKIWNKNKIPIFVGGSGFYIQSLLFPPKIKPSLNLNTLILPGRVNQDCDNLWQKLYDIDPIRAEKINKNDIYRIQRALDIWKSTGIKPSEYEPAYLPVSDFILIVLTRDRQELYKMINDRVVKMLNDGWVNEVKNLPSEWKSFLKLKKIIGYDDILSFLDNEADNDEDLLIEAIQQKVRSYAKRQMTFLKTLSKKIIKSELENKNGIFAKKIIWIDLSQTDIHSCIQNILKR